MKIALIGATGHIGSHIAQEAISRQHQVSAIVRSANVPPQLSGVNLVQADPFDLTALSKAVHGHDVIASAFGPGAESAALVPQVTKILVAAARASGIKHLVVVGGAGNLLVAPGLKLVDTPTFPEIYKAYALAHGEALAILREASDLQWTFFAPAALIGPGDKVGTFRTDTDQLISDAAGNSKISYADYADAFVSELETGKHAQQVLTVAY